MTDLHHDERLARDAAGRRREPLFMPLDVAAFVVALLMIWGPLAAGALRQ